MTSRIAIAEGTEITTHQRVLDAKPPLVDLNGHAVGRRECGGVMRAQDGDHGRGPVVVECDACGHVMGVARREPNATIPLLVGAGVADDGYAQF